MHISFDDVIDLFKDINKSSYKSVFDNQFLKVLYNLHNKYHVVFSLYCYYTDGKFSLTQCSERYAEEFARNRNWLRFGFHAYSSESDYSVESFGTDYLTTMNELKRITGNALDRCVRLHKYQGTQDAIMELRGELQGLLTADDERTSYGLSEKQIKEIATVGELKIADGIYYLRTNLRLEKVYRVKNELYEIMCLFMHVEIFTHEWCWHEQRKKLQKCCKLAYKNGVYGEFFEKKYWKN